MSEINGVLRVTYIIEGARRISTCNTRGREGSRDALALSRRLATHLHYPGAPRLLLGARERERERNGGSVAREN